MVLLLKLCAIPLYPLGFGLMLITIGLIGAFLHRRAGLYVAAAGAAILYVISTPFAAGFLLRGLESPYYDTEPASGEYPVIVVLGGGGRTIGKPREYPEISEAGDRILHAARLYKMGVAPRIVTSGGINAGSFHRHIVEGEHNAMLLREIGVDSLSIIVERRSRTTADHGPLVGAILDSLGLPRRAVIVTSAAHMKRALGVFRKNGFAAIPAATDFQSQKYLLESVRDFFPSASALERVTAAVHEIYGIVGYRMMGRI